MDMWGFVLSTQESVGYRKRGKRWGSMSLAAMLVAVGVGSLPSSLLSLPVGGVARKELGSSRLWRKAIDLLAGSLVSTIDRVQHISASGTVGVNGILRHHPLRVEKRAVQGDG